MAVVRINYLEPNPDSYESVKISLYSGEEIIFDSGDFVKDWYQVGKYLSNMENWEPVIHSSSVDHFIMDGAPFDSGYLHIIDDKPILKYPKREGEGWYNNTDFDGIEVFVKRGEMPTWEEYKEYCNS